MNSKITMFTILSVVMVLTISSMSDVFSQTDEQIPKLFTSFINETKITPDYKNPEIFSPISHFQYVTINEKIRDFENIHDLDKISVTLFDGNEYVFEKLDEKRSDDDTNWYGILPDNKHALMEIEDETVWHGLESSPTKKEFSERKDGDGYKIISGFIIGVNGSYYFDYDSSIDTYELTKSNPYFVEMDDTPLNSTNEEIMIREMLVNDGDRSLEEIDRLMIKTFPENYPELQPSYSISHLTEDIRKEIELFSNAYVSGRDYSDKTVTVSLTIGYTPDADNNISNIKRAIERAVDDANTSFRLADLPINLDVESIIEVRGYTEQSTIGSDVGHLKLDLWDDLDQLKGQALRDEADIILLITHYGDKVTPCGQAGEVMVEELYQSVAVIRDTCLGEKYLSLTHEIGHLFGAMHNPEENEPDESFSFAHGYLVPVHEKMTIMSKNNPTLCDPDSRGIECERLDYWSDPEKTFQGTTHPTGTDKINFNSKMLFGSAQHIASLNGEVQRYDADPPKGIIEIIGELINKIFNQGDKVEIKAKFNEPIHDDYPAYVTITNDNTLPTTSQMAKQDQLTFTYSHQLTREVGEVNFSFSNARDVYMNEVVTDPTSGGTITVIAPDITSPTLTVPYDRTFEATAINTSLRLIQIGMATATDDRDSNPIITNNAPTSFPIGDTTITYTATDISGNFATGIQIITIQDTTNPVFSTINDITKEATNTNTPVTITNPTVTDIFSVSITNNSTGSYPLGDTLILFTATDSNGNIATNTQRITIQDTTSPLITIPNNVIIEATAINTPYTVSNANATDIFNVNITNNAPNTFDLGNTTIIHTATDSTGNNSTGIQTVTIQDTTPPTITVPNDISVNQNETVTLGTPIIYDIFDVTITNNSTGIFPIGDTIIQWIATDSNGNISTETQTVTVITLEKPSPVTIKSNPKDNSMILYWNIPQETIDGYHVKYRTSSTFGHLTSEWIDTDGKYFVGKDNIHFTVIHELDNLKLYNFVVIPYNSIHTGDDSNIQSDIPNENEIKVWRPSPPLNVSVKSIGDSKVVIQWDKPIIENGYPIVDYKVHYSMNGNNWIEYYDGVSTDTEMTITELENKKSYMFRVVANNVVMDSFNSIVTSATLK